MVMRKIYFDYTIDNLEKIVNSVNENDDEITMISDNKSAVMISENKWKNICKTLELYSIPNLVKNINNIRNNEDWNSATEYDKNIFNQKLLKRFIK